MKAFIHPSTAAATSSSTAASAASTAAATPSSTAAAVAICNSGSAFKDQDALYCRHLLKCKIVAAAILSAAATAIAAAILSTNAAIAAACRYSAAAARRDGWSRSRNSDWRARRRRSYNDNLRVSVFGVANIRADGVETSNTCAGTCFETIAQT